MLPMYLWFITGEPLFRSPWLVAPWMAFIAILMVSSVATFGWSSLRLRRRIRFEVLVLIVGIGAALISAPWPTLIVLCVVYLATIPFSIAGYARIKRQRASMTAAPPA
jgi:CDP-diacylglycerol--serine O-phosphatidyltransferase